MCATACVYKELYGKIKKKKKNCVNNYLIWNEVFQPQMCRGLVSCAVFKPFWRRLVKLFETVSPPSKRIMERQTTRVHRWPEVTPQIAFSSTGKVSNCDKNNSSIEPNKFYFKYLCFGGRKTREERKICLKIHLFGFPQRLVMRPVTTAARNVVSFSTLIGPFWARADNTTLHQRETYISSRIKCPTRAPKCFFFWHPYS